MSHAIAETAGAPGRDCAAAQWPRSGRTV